MTKDVLVLFAKYNAAVNEKMNVLFKTLSNDEWNRNLGGFFPSIRSMTSHIYIADFNWLKRMANLREFKTTGVTLFSGSHGFHEELFPNMADYFSSRAELDQHISAFAGEITDEDLSKNLRYNDSGGNPHEKNFGSLLLHVFNHGTHHRGMLSLYLELLGKENDFNSLSQVI